MNNTTQNQAQASAQTAAQRPELSFDGCGINGPDEYRTRLATFNRDSWSPKAIKKYGELFAAAPETAAQRDELLEKNQQSLTLINNLLGWMRYVRLPVGEQHKNDFASDIDAARAAIARAEVKP